MTEIAFDILTFGIALYAAAQRWPHLVYRWHVIRYYVDPKNPGYETIFVLSRPDRTWRDVESGGAFWHEYQTVRRYRWQKPVSSAPRGRWR